MTSMTGFGNPTPEQLEARAASTRAALDAKLHELEQRLSPREQLQRVRSRIEPERYLGAAAVTAVAVGATLAFRGLRRRIDLHGAPGSGDELISTSAYEPLP